MIRSSSVPARPVRRRRQAPRAGRPLPPGIARPALAAVLTACVAAAGLLLPGRASAHDIPNEIVLTGFVKPAGDRLHFVVRVPLIMLSSINLPKRGAGYLALDRMDERLDRAVAATARQVRIYEEGRLLHHGRAEYRISRMSDRSFDNYSHALAHIQGEPLPNDAQVFWNQGYFDLHMAYPIRSEQAHFVMDFGVGRGLSGRLKLAVRYLPPGGPSLAYLVHGGYGRFALNPRWYDAAAMFVRNGFHHILDGTDHLLFLLCLVIPFGLGSLGRLASVVTAFTVAHSVTLISSALGYVPSGQWFAPLIEVLIAASILYMAIENVIAVQWHGFGAGILNRRWLVTAAFGLAHGFGFSAALRDDLQFVGSHLLLSLFSFNLGVELGQLLVLIAVLPAIALLFRTDAARNLCIVVTSVLVGHTAWHWLTERAQALRYVQWPSVTPEVTAWALGAAALLSSTLLVLRWIGRRGRTAATVARRPGE